MNTITRYRKDANLTELQLANLAGVSRDYIVKLEQTTYTTPSGRILEVLSDLTYTTESEILAEYLAEWHAKTTGIELMNDWELIKDEWRNELAKRDDHPHVILRQILARRIGIPGSQIRWAKWGSIHPAILSKYELGKTVRLAESIKDHLRRLGAGSDLLSFLNEEVEKWCEDD